MGGTFVLVVVLNVVALRSYLSVDARPSPASFHLLVLRFCLVDSFVYATIQHCHCGNGALFLLFSGEKARALGGLLHCFGHIGEALWRGRAGLFPLFSPQRTVRSLVVAVVGGAILSADAH